MDSVLIEKPDVSTKDTLWDSKGREIVLDVLIF